MSGFRRVASSHYAKVYSFEYEGQKFFYKSFLNRNRLDPIKRIFRESRAERALNGHLLLQENGFFTPLVIAVGKKGLQNFMVSKSIDNGLGLRQYFKEEFLPPLPKEGIRVKRKMICELGYTIGQMHRLGIYHGDLGLGNVIFTPSDPFHSRYAFIDNERTVYYKRLPNRKIVKNLSQLNMIFDSTITNTDRLRFFHAYLRKNPTLALQKNTLIKRVLKKTGKRIARKVKKDPKWGGCSSLVFSQYIHK